MKVLKVIHGYPPKYSAGSEVYSKLLAEQLSNKHHVEIFTRQENSFLPDYFYQSEINPEDPRIKIHVVNVPRTKYRDTYIHTQVDDLYKKIIQELKPHIVHFGHLNHLSMNLPIITNSLNIPSVMTLHDYWLMCPRGQFLQRNSQNPWDLCGGQNDKKCATMCYAGNFSGDAEFRESEIAHHENWINARMKKAHEVIKMVDYFIAPSKYLEQKFISEFALPKDKVKYLDYGFSLASLKNRKRIKEDEFVFGYIGTLTPQKGIQDLLHAFEIIPQDIKTKLRIWGIPSEETAGLISIADNIQKKGKLIQWMGRYDNAEIVEKVFNNVDAIIVPSIWEENSPLVIHEALQVRVPIITANYGGMREYIHHNVNGLLFEHRNHKDLATQMLKLSKDRLLAINLGKRGYLSTTNGDIPAIKEHAIEVEKIYEEICLNKGVAFPKKAGPWRITFDTNPDHCNYKCIMCECFSPHSKIKQNRIANREKRRIMPIEIIQKIIKDSKESPLTEIIPSTMGEPLLYKDFDKIIDLCKENNLKLNLTTNGSFPIKGAKTWGELLIPICSDIKFSINGASKKVNQEIMLGSKWEEQLENISTIIAIRDNHAKKSPHRCTLTFQVTFLKSNIQELEDLLFLAIKLGIDRLKGHHLWAHFDEIKNLSMRKDQNSIQQWNKIVEKLYKIKAENLLSNGKEIKLENIHFLDENNPDELARGGVCPFLGKEAWINTKGEFSPCCAPDNLRKTLGNFGSVVDKSIEDIFLSDEYQDLKKSYLNNKLCKSCNMKKPIS